LASLIRVIFGEEDVGLIQGLFGDGVGVIVIPMTEINSPGVLKTKVDAELDGRTFDSLTLFGDFWLNKETDFINDTQVVLWNVFFDGTALSASEGGRVPMSPTEFLFARVDSVIAHYKPVKLMSTMCAVQRSSCPLFFKLLDERCCGKNHIETQSLVTGLMNYHEFSGTLEERFTQFFKRIVREPSLEMAVLAVGHAEVEPQLELVRNRVKENSSVCILVDDVECAVATASELVNLTHEELHKQYPEVPLTCVVKLWVTGKEYQLAHSLRSWNPLIDASAILKPMGGGGSATAAGVRFPTDLHIPYEDRP
jgi:hypothetical protein